MKNKVILSAWVDPVIRDYARTEAKRNGLKFSEFIERVIREAVSAASVRRLTD